MVKDALNVILEHGAETYIHVHVVLYTHIYTRIHPHIYTYTNIHNTGAYTHAHTHKYNNFSSRHQQNPASVNAILTRINPMRAYYYKEIRHTRVHRHIAYV